MARSIGSTEVQRGNVRGTIVVLLLFVGNELAGALMPSMAYILMRVAVVPLACAVNLFAQLFWVLRRKDARTVNAASIVGIGVSIGVWAFQWFVADPLFPWR
jgi:hypothetical protein